MYKENRFLIVVVSLAAITIPPLFHQRHTLSHNSNSTKNQLVSAKQSTKAGSNQSVVGIYLDVITSDYRHNIWMGGSVWLLQALLVRNDGKKAIGVTLPFAQTITELTFTGPETAWLIANYKYLYRTDDGGSTWQRFLKGRTNLTSICFSDAKQGWAAGWHGIIYHTADGGASWQEQVSGTELDLEKILFVDALHGWAMGGKARVEANLQWTPVLLTTLDGGRRWKTVNPCPTLRGIAFVDQYRGWGINSEDIFHTTNGGQTWRIQHTADPLSLSSIFFLDEREGWVIGNEVLHTDNGGETWTRLNVSALPTPFKHVVFVDSRSGWAIGSGLGPESFGTTDGGKTWEAVPDGWKDEVVEKVRHVKFGQKDPKR